LKILDATTIIAIFHEISCPKLIEKIEQLGHELAIPSNIMKRELLDEITLQTTKKYVRSKTIQILNSNTIEEIREFQKDSPGLGLGECDSMLTYQKMRAANQTVYCILDDGKARSKASELGIEFTGLIGLLKMMKQRNVMSREEIDDVVKSLKKSSFRFPLGVVI